MDAVLCVVIGIDAKGICFFNGSEFGAAIGVEAQIRCLVGVVPWIWGWGWRGVLRPSGGESQIPAEQAAEYGLQKDQMVQVKVSGERQLIFGDVQVVFTDGMEEPMMHVDVEEANAACIHPMDIVEILPQE